MARIIREGWFAGACIAATLFFVQLPVEGQSTGTAQIAPPTTLQATRGLSQTLSAEPMGSGRLTFNLTGSWYKQEIGYSSLTPVEGSHVSTGLTAFSFGVNSFVDVFGSIAGYGIIDPSPGDNLFGLGAVSGGIIGSLPLPSVSPLCLGGMFAIIGGTSTNQIDLNLADGYNYFSTRRGYDFMGKAMQTVMFGNESQGIKFHFNEGAVYSLQANHDLLLLLSAGVQGSVHPMLVLGLEANSRTFVQETRPMNDPLWLTTSAQFRTPYYFNIHLGGDVSLSKNRDGADKRALEPFRIFGGIVFSMDMLAGQRRALAEKDKQDAAEKEAMARKAQSAEQRADSLAKKAQQDSIALVKARAKEKRRADSLAKKAQQDSIALAETQKRLEEERSKRSDAEKQLLSTGLLLLDAVYFETGKAEISINSYPYLNIIGKMLTKYPKLQIEVSGHTDNIGRLNMNMMLSQARADAVRTYLIQVAPELSTMLSGRGYGPSQPKAPNTSANGRKMNRRVELQVLNREALKEYNK
ncbi:MAG: OmpA family protein [Chitinispirillaceae bacterium]|nr:OmpA family protein [Chitinispirillaceae bacterium]